MSRTPEEKAADDAAIKKAISELGERFDTVQIFVSRYLSGENSDTLNLSEGTGNFFARYGQARMWVRAWEEKDRLEVQDWHEKQKEE